MKIKTIALFVLAWTLCCISALAQGNTRIVNGIVTDEAGEALVGARVSDSNNNQVATLTDTNGLFSIRIGVNSDLKVSYVGYISQTVKPTVGKMRIVLKEDSKQLDEVLVVAFGKQTRESFTGSAGVVKTDEIAKATVTNPMEAINGRVAGVQMTTSSAQMGSSPSITIRGFGSISSGTSPLIVVDGLPYDGSLNLINNNDIESITVLKDAASNALYGARGANGVIMITTKKGKAGDAKVTLDAKWGVNQNGLKNYKTLNAKQFYETYYNMIYNYYVASEDNGGKGYSASEAHEIANSLITDNSTGPGYMVYTVPTGQDFILQGGTMNPNATLGALYTYNGTTLWLQPDDWEKEGLQDGFRQEYNLGVSGALDKVNYYTSLGYLDQEGIQKGSDERRLTARAKLDFQAKKWLKMGANVGYTRYEYHQTSEGTIGSGTIWAAIKNQAPIYPVYFRDASGNIMIDQWGQKMYDFAQQYNLNRGGGVGGNCIFNNLYRESGYEGESITAGGFADFDLYDGLKLTVNGNMYSYTRRYQYTNSPFVDYYTSSSTNGSLSKGTYNTRTYNTQQLLNYDKRFGNHGFNAMVGHEFYKYTYKALSGSGYNFGIDGATELAQMLNLNRPSSSASEYNNEGYFFRAMYDYSTKYFGSFSFRRDASSRFAVNHRWGNFWSAGGAWIISKEDFFNVDWINMLKIKASVGSQGNDNIGSYRYADTYSIVNNNDEVAYQWSQKGTEDITWETNTNWNAGLEFDLFNNRLSGSLDFFYRKTTDMLFSLSSPPSIGYTSYYTNLGDMRNLGAELTLNASIIRSKDFNWDITFNITRISNKVLKLPKEVLSTTVDGYEGFIDLDASFVSMYKYFVAEGLSLYTWYLPKYAGTDPETGAAMYYKDVLDDDGNVVGQETTFNGSEATDYIIGDALPLFSGGLGMSFTFKGFDLAFNTNFQIGGKVYGYNYQVLMHTGGRTSTNWHVDILDAWTPDNTSSQIPRLRYSETYSQTLRSDRFITNASYLCLQNLNVGYTLPQSLTKKWGIENMRVFFAGENLAYVSARQGLDPRYSLIGVTNNELYSPMRTLSGGVSLTF